MGSDELGKALKDARIAALFAAGCVVLVAVLLMIDGQRNKVMLQHVTNARRIVDEFYQVAGQVMQGAAGAGAVASAAGMGGAAADVRGTGGDGADRVVADAPAGAGVDSAGVPGAVPVNGTQPGRAGMAGGPRGNG